MNTRLVPRLPPPVAAGLVIVALLSIAACSAEPPRSSQLEAGSAVEAAEPASNSAFRLVLLVAVDQLRADRLEAALPGGLGRLRREGRVFVDAALDHAHTTTCVGHATMLTGRHPGPIGIPGNSFVECDTLKSVYCVEDRAADAAIAGRAGGGPGGRSPRNMQASTLGDWLKAQRPGARVFSVSAKDRAAITMAGQHPDGVYWLDRLGSGGFATSRYYVDALPKWAASWSARRLLRDSPEYWEHATEPLAGRPDDYPAENPRFSRTSPHPVAVRLRGDGVSPLPAIGRLYSSPFMDELTLDFARDLVQGEELGRGTETDLLAISLSATDAIGHLYGPWSLEAHDALRRLDRALGEFLDFLEQRVGADRLLVVLTADHGVMPLPEWMLEQGTSDCPLEAGRGNPAAVLSQLSSALDQAFPPAAAEPASPWFAQAGYCLTFNRRKLSAREIELEPVLATAKEWLEATPGVERVWTRDEMAAGRGPEAFATLYRNSFHPERGGDVAIQPARGCLLSVYTYGTSHGSPYDYDRDIPLVFFGRGVEAGVVAGAAATVDIAPTLAAELGIAAPAGLDGRVQSLRTQSDAGS
jgi:predicted AlkP superfamily pyrophosphatase or phosphodiesterase